ncbi:Na(+)/H(+) exchanger beta-like, partial [Pollicipes pollicipes]|uniref:Na(+)/H(+) exchanger beta-like n=1 Tax=Pollicipes pollicipes TaxID=41117 RepID=UPI001884BCEB
GCWAASPAALGAQLARLRAARSVVASAKEARDETGHVQRERLVATHTDSDGTKYQYCVEREEVKEEHGIHVASWRWTEVQTYYAITLFIVIAGLAKLGFHHAHFLSSKLPESCLLIILGIFVGIITYHIRHRLDGETFPAIAFVNTSVRVLDCEDEFAGFFPKFDSELFFLVLLPPIVLEASYSLHDRTFLDNLGTVLLFAVVGTLFNMFIIGPALYGLAVSGAMGSSMLYGGDAVNATEGVYDISNVSLVQMLTFSSLIVAVDPVAVLAIFQEVGVNKDLYFLVFGESLLNDAVTVVLYNAMVAFTGMEGEDIAYDQILLAVAAFFCVSLGGLAIGIIFGVLTAVITKYTPDVRVVEPLSLLAMAYLAYLSAELVHFSGIIATVGCGVVQAHYAMKNISKNSYITIKYFVTMASSTSDTIIFMFLGMVLVSKDHHWHTGFSLWTLVLCLVVRFIGVYLLSWLANFRRLRRIGRKEQFIMAYGGLRGAVGFSLVVMLRGSAIDETTVRIFVTTTLFIVLFTVFVQGSTIKLLVGLFNIKLEETEDPTLTEEIAATTVDHITAGVEEIIGYRGSNFFKERLEWFDEKYLKPLLISDSLDSSLARLYDKLVLDEHFANLYGPAAAVETEKGGMADIVQHEADFFLPEEDLLHLKRRSKVLRESMRRDSLRGFPHPLSRVGSLRDRFTRRFSSTSVTPRTADSEGGTALGSITEPTSPTTPSFNPEDNYRTYPHDGAMLRKAFRNIPYNKLHFRYNPNLIDEEDQEMETHLRRRRANAQRFSQLAQVVAAKQADQSKDRELRRTVSGGGREAHLHMPGVADLVMAQRRRALERQRQRYVSAPSSGSPALGADEAALGPISEESLRTEDRELLPRLAPQPQPRARPRSSGADDNNEESRV